MRRLAWTLCLALLSAPSFAGVPPEIQGVLFSDRDSLSWSAAAADGYHVYRGAVSGLSLGEEAICHGFDLDSTLFSTDAEPETSSAYYYLVTGESDLLGEGPPGTTSAGVPRVLTGSCRQRMHAHVQNRLGFGQDEWSRDRIDAIGLGAYIDEQLDPDSIDESTNANLNNRLVVYDPPTTIFDLIGRQVVESVYARRQLEQQVALFWDNHFNTFWLKVADVFTGVFPQCQGDPPPDSCDPNYPEVAYREASLAEHRELEKFRDIAFNGNFREMLEASATSLAMIIYLDTYANLAVAPNENYSRELLELYAMGVNGGYTQQDVEELARVLTGWTGCKKKINQLDDPLPPCIGFYWLPDPPGEWTSVFDVTRHDCGAKTLFAGTPEQYDIPDTCGNPVDGVNDLGMALDAIVAHPSTAEFISRKILVHFVTDSPDQAMIDTLVAVWNDGSNPQGVGDLREVLRAALTLDAFLDPDRVASKIKTPLEHFVSAFRGTRGFTDGLTTVLDYLIRAQQIPHYNPVPVGFPETGSPWLDTTNTLERQNFGLDLSVAIQSIFGSDLMGLLEDNGVSTAPGNSAAIIDFFDDTLFGGALSTAERQAAMDYLDTDEFGLASAYDEARIRETVGVLLGFPQFQEQ